MLLPVAALMIPATNGTYCSYVGMYCLMLCVLCAAWWIVLICPTPYPTGRSDVGRGGGGGGGGGGGCQSPFL